MQTLFRFRRQSDALPSLHCAMFVLIGVLLCGCLFGSPAWAETRPDIVWMHGGYSGIVSLVQFSPDRTLIAAGDGSAIKLKRAADGALLHTFYYHPSFFGPRGNRGFKFSPDGMTLIAVDSDNSLRLWNVRTGVLTRKIAVVNMVLLNVCYSPDGQTIAVSGSLGIPDQSVVRLYKVSDGTQLAYNLPTNFSVEALSYSPDGQTLLLGSYGVLALYNAAAGTLVRKVSTSGVIRDIIFTPDGSKFTTLGDAVTLWNTSDFSFRTFGDRRIASAAFSGGRTYLRYPFNGALSGRSDDRDGERRPDVKTPMNGRPLV